MRYLICLLAVFLVLTSCVACSDRTESPAKIMMTKVDLFKGDAAKFQPFLGNMTSAIKLRYEGMKPNMRLDIDIWKDGKKFASAGSIEDLFFSASDRDRRELEVIISIDTVSMDNRLDNVVKIGTIHNPGSGLYTFNVPMDVKLTARSPLSNVDRITFGANETVPVFGMQATSNNSLSAADLSEESISKLEWALIFTLNPNEQ